jgi:hypothetical protein
MNMYGFTDRSMFSDSLTSPTHEPSQGINPRPLLSASLPDLLGFRASHRTTLLIQGKGVSGPWLKCAVRGKTYWCKEKDPKFRCLLAPASDHKAMEPTLRRCNYAVWVQCDENTLFGDYDENMRYASGFRSLIILNSCYIWWPYEAKPRSS